MPHDLETSHARILFKQRMYYTVVFALSLALFAACVWAVKFNFGDQTEQRALLWVNNWPEWLNKIAMVVTLFGTVWAGAISVIAAFAFRLYALAWRLALSIFTAYGIAYLGKLYFMRPRPAESIPDLHVRVHDLTAAFPSAHAIVATVIGLTVLTYLPRLWGWAVVGLFIGTVVLSRLYLGLHAPFDVIAGFAVGAGVVSFWRIVPDIVQKYLRLKDD